MLTDCEFLTKHERGVMLAALRDYESKQRSKSQKNATARMRAISGANAYVAGDLIRQLSMR